MNPLPHGRERVERRSLWRVFRWPLVLGFLSVVGLVSALVGDGIWDVLSWIALFIPVAVIAGFCKRSIRRKTGSP